MGKGESGRTKEGKLASAAMGICPGIGEQREKFLGA